MKSISTFFYQRSTIWMALTSTLIMVLYASIVLGSKSSCFMDQLPEGMKVFGLLYGYDLSYALKFFSSLDQSAIVAYREFTLIWDNIFPVLYSLMYVFWLSFFFGITKIKSSKWSLINLFPLIPAVLDWIENTFELTMLSHYVNIGKMSSDLVQISSFISQSKWVASSLNYVVLFLAIILFTKNKLNRTKTI